MRRGATLPSTLGWSASGWLLDPSQTFLNHGSFGALPEAILRAADGHRRVLEARPIERLGRGIHGVLAPAKAAVARLVGADPERIGLVENATAGVAAVLSSIPWRAGDEVLTTSHAYNAVRQAARREADRFGITVTEVPVRLPVDGPADIVSAVESAWSRRTRLLIVDHVTSPSALVYPVHELVQLARDRGALVLVDGAHAPGMLPLRLEELGADWYTGNLHKWAYAPKGCAFLHASPERAPQTHPASVSHHYGSSMEQEFEWQGTRDVGAWMAIADAIAWMEERGIDAIMQHNRQLAQWAHEQLVASALCEAISPIDGSMRGSMAACRLAPRWREGFATVESLQAAILETGRVEVPCMELGSDWLVRVSAAPHNRPEHYERLIEVLRRLDPARGGSCAA